MTGIARFSLAALDARDPHALAAFYAAITGWEVEPHEQHDWVQLRNPAGGPTIACQLAPDHEPPDWPGAARPQQAHLDFDVDDLDEGERRVLALGARKVAFEARGTWRVYLDPAGHPFCLVLAG